VDLGIWHLIVSASSSSDNLVYQTGSAMALSRLEWVGRSGEHLSYLGDKGVYNGPHLSKDGQRFLITYGDPSHDVWLFDSAGVNKTRLTFDNTIYGEAIWSPDNSRFTTILGSANNTFHIVTRSTTGSGESVTLQQQANNNAVTDWSPDGRFLLTEHNTPTSYDVSAVERSIPSRHFFFKQSRPLFQRTVFSRQQIRRRHCSSFFRARNLCRSFCWWQRHVAGFHRWRTLVPLEP
jgi:Eukaryotic translation initiation factor eIF2A